MKCPEGSKAFSLVELLVVMGVLILLSSLLVPALSSVMRAGRVSQGAGMVASYVEMARLAAGNQCRPVEVRFYRGADPGYIALQLYILKDTGMEALTPLSYLPDGVVIAGDDRSSLLAVTSLGAGSGSGLTEGWTYLSFEIAPSGETTLPLGSTPLCLALGLKRVVADSTGPAAGLAAVCVDPLTAKARVKAQ